MDALLSKRFPNSDMNAGNKQELQRVVSKQFVSRLRGTVSVSVDMIANIRAQCRRCGWEYLGAPDQQQDACEFFSFIFLALGGQVTFFAQSFFDLLPFVLNLSENSTVNIRSADVVDLSPSDGRPSRSDCLQRRHHL